MTVIYDKGNIVRFIIFALLVISEKLYLLTEPQVILQVLLKAVEARKGRCSYVKMVFKPQMLKHAKALSESDGCCIFNLALKRLIGGHTYVLYLVNTLREIQAVCFLWTTSRFDRS